MPARERAGQSTRWASRLRSCGQSAAREAEGAVTVNLVEVHHVSRGGGPHRLLNDLYSRHRLHLRSEDRPHPRRRSLELTTVKRLEHVSNLHSVDARNVPDDARTVIRNTGSITELVVPTGECQHGNAEVRRFHDRAMARLRDQHIGLSEYLQLRRELHHTDV